MEIDRPKLTKRDEYMLQAITALISDMSDDYKQAVLSELQSVDKRYGALKDQYEQLQEQATRLEKSLATANQLINRLKGAISIIEGQSKSVRNYRTDIMP